MVRLLAVVERDLKKFKRNPTVLAMSILMPIIYLVILGNSFQGKLQELPMVVVNQDSGPYARRLMENLRAVEAGPQTVTILSTSDDKEAIDGVRKGRYKAGLMIPPDFSTKVVLKRRPEVGLFLDNTDAISADTIRNTVTGALRSISTDYVSVREKTDEIYLRDVDLYRKVDYYRNFSGYLNDGSL
jgi:ABC-2 type transport system permease protein